MQVTIGSKRGEARAIGRVARLDFAQQHRVSGRDQRILVLQVTSSRMTGLHEVDSSLPMPLAIVTGEYVLPPLKVACSGFVCIINDQLSAHIPRGQWSAG